MRPGPGAKEQQITILRGAANSTRLLVPAEFEGNAGSTYSIRTIRNGRECNFGFSVEKDGSRNLDVEVSDASTLRIGVPINTMQTADETVVCKYEITQRHNNALRVVYFGRIVMMLRRGEK